MAAIAVGARARPVLASTPMTPSSAWHCAMSLPRTRALPGLLPSSAAVLLRRAPHGGSLVRVAPSRRCVMASAAAVDTPADDSGADSRVIETELRLEAERSYLSASFSPCARYMRSQAPLHTTVTVNT